eukprot:XP_001699620.1 predicted protein [Chlamydomonas reinhardtii]
MATGAQGEMFVVALCEVSGSRAESCRPPEFGVWGFPPLLTGNLLPPRTAGDTQATAILRSAPVGGLFSSADSLCATDIASTWFNTSTLAQLTTLTKLDLSNNKATLDGTGLPLAYSALSNLVQLNLSYSNLQGGPVPSAFHPEWSQLTGIQSGWIDLSSNRYLGGNVPDSWSALAGVENINVANTGACGTPNAAVAAGLSPASSPLPTRCERVDFRKVLEVDLKPVLNNATSAGSKCDLNTDWDSTRTIDTWTGVTAVPLTTSGVDIFEITALSIADCWANNGQPFSSALPTNLTPLSSLTVCTLSSTLGTRVKRVIRKIDLSSNTLLTGPLPASWSALNDTLTFLNVSGTALTPQRSGNHSAQLPFPKQPAAAFAVAVASSINDVT